MEAIEANRFEKCEENCETVSSTSKLVSSQVSSRDNLSGAESQISSSSIGNFDTKNENPTKEIHSGECASDLTVNGSQIYQSSLSLDRTSNEVNTSKSDENMSIKVPIVGYETMEERAKFTIFKLQIVNEKIGDSWMVFRRYTDFVRFHSKLKEDFPSINVPLPPKRWLRDNFETAFLEVRMKGLQAFVDSVLVNPTLAASPNVRKFFCLDEPPFSSDNCEETQSFYGSLDESMLHAKNRLADKESEIDVLKTELALVTAQRDNLLKLTKNCRNCTQYQKELSILQSKMESNTVETSKRKSSAPNSRFSSPLASSSPVRARTRLSMNNNGSEGSSLQSSPNDKDKLKAQTFENRVASANESPVRRMEKRNLGNSQSSSIDEDSNSQSQSTDESSAYFEIPAASSKEQAASDKSDPTLQYN